MGILLRAAAFLTRRQWAGWHDLTAKPQEIQDHLLFDLIKRNRATRFGRDHHFEAIRSLSDYRAQVSVGDYERLRPYIEHAQNGEAHALTAEPVLMFTLTSGSSLVGRAMAVNAAVTSDANAVSSAACAR